MSRTRKQNLTIIDELWGAPGLDRCTDDGLRLFRRVVETIGTNALTDAAVHALADAHLHEEGAIARLPNKPRGAC